MYWIIVFAVATVLALRGAYRGTKKAYRSRRQAWHNDHPNANGFESAAAAFGNMLGMVRYGPPALVRGFRDGFTGGWTAARDWAGYEYRGEPSRAKRVLMRVLGRPDTPEVEEPPARPASMTPRPAPTPAPPEPEPQPAPAPNPAGDNVVPIRRPKPTPAPAPAAEPQPAPDPVPAQDEETPMAATVNTATGGDVHDAQQNLAEANSVVAESVAEEEDAVNDLARYDQIVKYIRDWENALRAAAVPPERIAEVSALIPLVEAQHEAAGQRRGAANVYAGIATGIQQVAAADAQYYGKAAGTWYGQTRNAAPAKR